MRDPAQLPRQSDARPKLAKKAPGQWRVDFAINNMSPDAAKYQARATGTSVGKGYYISGSKGWVQFDGYRNGTLLEAKYYTEGGRFLNDPHWRIVTKGWGLLKQARAQLAVAGSTPIEWRVASPRAAQLIQQLFDFNKIKIAVRYFP